MKRLTALQGVRRAAGNILQYLRIGVGCDEINMSKELNANMNIGCIDMPSGVRSVCLLLAHISKTLCALLGSISRFMRRISPKRSERRYAVHQDVESSFAFNASAAFRMLSNESFHQWHLSTY